jgi:anti-sigma regulatory factor (Ser/Thr protein kinase)
MGAPGCLACCGRSLFGFGKGQFVQHSDTTERLFGKRTDSLESIFGYISGFAASHGVSDDITAEMQFVVEEVFTNMVRYNRESQNDVVIRLSIENGSFLISLADRDVHSFDPNSRPPVDVTKPLHERTPGGLGIHLIREMMDEVRYEYENRTARITLIKHLEK